MEGLDIFSMNFSKDLNEIAFWLSSVFYSNFNNRELNAWIFGSLVSDCTSSNDCDVLIFIDEKCITSLANISPVWRQEFEKRFNCPLHLTRLTFQEAHLVKSFTEAVFSKPVIRLHS